MGTPTLEIQNCCFYLELPFENADILLFKHKPYEWIPPNALFPRMFLLFVKE